MKTLAAVERIRAAAEDSLPEIASKMIVFYKKTRGQIADRPSGRWSGCAPAASTSRSTA